MFIDHPPMLNCPARQVIVLEEGDKPYTVIFADHVLEQARAVGATSRDADGSEIFWVVFADELERVWDMSELALRSDLRRPKAERMSEQELITLGDEAPIGELLETFGCGNLGSFAQRDMPRVCRELEVFRLGQLAKLTRSEIAGENSSLAGNKTLEWINYVLSKFGKPELRHF